MNMKKKMTFLSVIFLFAVFWVVPAWASPKITLNKTSKVLYAGAVQGFFFPISPLHGDHHRKMPVTGRDPTCSLRDPDTPYLLFRKSRLVGDNRTGFGWRIRHHSRGRSTATEAESLFKRKEPRRIPHIQERIAKRKVEQLPLPLFYSRFRHSPFSIMKHVVNQIMYETT